MTNRDDYRKFSQLLNLIQDLCRPIGGMTYDDIMTDLDCGRKTAERTIKFLGEQFGDALIASDDPTNSKIRRFRLDMPDGLPPTYLHSSEIIALNAATKRIKNEDIRSALQSLEYKLNRMLQYKKSTRELNDLEAMVMSRATTAAPYPYIKTNEKTLNAIQYAIISGTKIWADHKTEHAKSGLRKLCPLGFLYGHTNNYLVAYRDDEPDITRTYILTNLHNVRNTREHFDAKNFDIEKYATQSFGAFHSTNGPYDIQWRADASVADAIKRYVFHPTQKFIPQSDGSVIIKMRADGFYEMSWYLFQWGGKIKPIAPIELVETYNQLLRNIING